MNDDLKTLFEVFKKPLVDIGNTVLEIRRRGLSAEEKTSFQDIKTKGDTDAEASLVGLITSQFPDDGIQGEEGASKPSQSGYRWYLDPIDGTTVYAAGLDFFGISGGRARDGRSDFGIIRYPALGYSIFALRGAGAWLDDGKTIRPLREQPSPRTLRESVIVFDMDVSKERALRESFRRSSMMIVKFGSCVYESSLVARGLLGAYLNNMAHAHDAAAVAIIAEEAGCVVSGLDGNPIDLRNKIVPFAIAGNEAIMEEVLRLFNQPTDH